MDAPTPQTLGLADADSIDSSQVMTADPPPEVEGVTMADRYRRTEIALQSQAAMLDREIARRRRLLHPGSKSGTKRRNRLARQIAQLEGDQAKLEAMLAELRRRVAADAA